MAIISQSLALSVGLHELAENRRVIFSGLVGSDTLLHHSGGAGEKCSLVEYVVKKYYLLSALVVIVNLLATPIVFFIGSSYGSNTLLQALLLYILLISVHELVHYIVAKRRSPAVRLRPSLRHGVIVVDYMRLEYKDFMLVASAPLIIVQLPITLLYLVLSHPLLALAPAPRTVIAWRCV
jgi:hypothetical protein